MAFHRNSVSLQLAKQPSFNPLDLEGRLVSPRGSLPGVNNVHNTSGRRRRLLRFRWCEYLTWALLALCIVASFMRFHAHVQVVETQQRSRVPIDVVGVSLKPSCVTRQAVASLNLYLKPRVIHVVTTNADKCRIYTSFAPNVVCHLQDEFLDGLNVDAVGEYIEQQLGVDQHKHFKGRELSGWYMQQFLKLGSALALPDLSPHYVVWDLDMVLLRPVQLLFPPDPSDPPGTPPRTLVNIGGSTSPGYVAAFRRLMRRPLEYAPDGSSFVTHWMVVYKPYLLEFLRELATGVRTPAGAITTSGGTRAGGSSSTTSGDGEGGPGADTLADTTAPDPLGWVWRILSAVEPSSADLGFSEYASYISWVRQRYPGSQQLAPHKTWVRHPFGQGTVKVLRLLRADRCCCPSGGLLLLVRALGFSYTGYEVGHIEECRYSEPQHETSYGL